MYERIISAAYWDSVSVKTTHYHDCHQILYITDGTAQLRVNEETYQVGAGNIVIISRLEHHSVTEQSDDYRRYVLQLTPDSTVWGNSQNRLYSMLFNRPDGFSNVLHTGDHPGRFRELFAAILEEIEQSRPLGTDMQNLLVEQLLIAIYRLMPEPADTLQENWFSVVLDIQRQLETEYSEPYTLAELAQRYGLSASYLSHIFKNITGTSVMGYLQSCRLAAAKQCLADTDLSISQVVEQCGFSDSSNFSRTFRNVTGLTPTDFRQKYRRKQ